MKPGMNDMRARARKLQSRFWTFARMFGRSILQIQLFSQSFHWIFLWNLMRMLRGQRAT